MDTLWQKSSSVELSEGEQLVTTARYGSSKVGGVLTDHFIYITDKRIVTIDNANDHIVRDEILVEDVAHVHGGIKKLRHTALAVLGIIFLFAAGICAIQIESMGFIPCLVCLGLCLLFLILYYLLGAKSFVLQIECKGVYSDLISVGISSITRSRSRRKGKKVKIKVDAAAADRVLSSIGKVMASKH